MDAVPDIPDFELIRRVGGGSYGDVWLGRSVTGVYRAIKIVERARFADARPFDREFDGISRFQRAVKNRPRQLALLHVGYNESAGFLYYVMELADDVTAGTDIDPATYVPLTLKELRLRRSSALPASECIKLGVELAGALSDLHETGLIHRDVKPSNIIFVSGVPKLADVGLIASSEQTLTSLGTVGYAPPEGSGTARADLYSLGKILYEMLTGLGPSEFPRLPLEIVNQDATGTTSELNEVILRACDPDPTQRYDGSRAMLDELLLLQAGRSVQDLRRTKARFRQLKRLSVIIGILALIGLTMSGIINYTSLKRLAAQETAYRHLAEADERWSRYTSSLHLAQLGRINDDYGVTRNALRREIPKQGETDLRGLEWWALWNDTAGDSDSILGAVGGPPIRNLALSSDNRELVAQAGESPQAATVWNLEAQTSQALSGVTLGVTGFSHDDNRLFLGTADRKIQIRDWRTNVPSAFLTVTGRILQSCDHGRKLLVSEHRAAGQTLTLWDTERQHSIGEWTTEGRPLGTSVSAAAASDNGRWLAVSLAWPEGANRKRELVVYDLEKRVEKFHVDQVESVQFVRISSDNQWVAVAMLGRPISVFAMESGREIWRLTGHSGAVHAVEFSPDNQLMASAGADQTVRIWDINTGQGKAVFRGHESAVTALAWFSDGKRLISGGDDGTCRIWPLPSHAKATGIRNLWTDILGDFVFSPDGRLVVATDSNGDLLAWSRSDLALRTPLHGGFQPLEFSSDNRTLLALTASARLVSCELASGEFTPVAALQNPQKLTVAEVAASTRMAAFGFEDGQVEVWDTARRKIIEKVDTGPDMVFALAWSPSARQLAVGGWSGKIAIKSLEPGKLVQPLSLESSPVMSLAFSPDGKWLAVGRFDGRVAIWDWKEKKRVREFAAHSASVSAILFSPDGSRLISAGGDGVIFFWAAPTSRQVAAWTVAEPGSVAGRGISRVKFDALGEQLAVMTDDGRLRLWSVKRDSPRK